jgi:hypothetical protein
VPIVSLAGTSRMYLPFDMRIIRETSFQSVIVDATDECVASGGRVWFQERIRETSPGVDFTKNIVRVWFRFGTVVKAGGSGLQVQLRTIEPFVSADQPKPNSTIEETVAIATGDANFASNTFYRTGTFSAPRPVFFAEKLAVVICFNSSGRLGSDSFAISGRFADVVDGLWSPWLTRNVSGSWVVTEFYPVIVLEFDDGSYGTLNGAYITAGVSSTTFSSSSTFNEWGLQFSVPYAMSLDQAVAYLGLNSTGSNFELNLYQGTSLMYSRTIEADVTSVIGVHGRTASDIKEFTFTSEQTVNSGSNYVLAIKPTTTNSVTLLYETLADAGHSELWGTSDLALVKRNGSGAWTVESAAAFPLMGVRVSARQDEA